MKENKVKEEFIKLRVAGLSFDKISKELKTNRVTLMTWEKKFSREIGELEFIEFENLKEKFVMGKKARLENYGVLLEKAKTELQSRDWKDVSSDKLLNIINELEIKFRKEIKDISYLSEETEERKDIFGEVTNSSKYEWDLQD